MSPATYEKYMRFKKNLQIATDKKKKHCPTPDCDSVVDVSKVIGNKVDCK